MFSRILFACLIMAAVVAPRADAANLTVPGTHATLSAAISAAASSDTITITSSGSFAESILIDKPLTIKAAAGQTPKITGNGTTAYVVYFTSTTAGTKFGDNAGGQIVISGDSFDTTASVLREMLVQTSGSLPLTIENVKFTSIKANYSNSNTPPAGTIRRDNHMFMWVGGTTVTQPVSDLNLFNVDFENGSHGVWMASLTNTGRTVRIEDCNVDVKNFGIFTTGNGNILMNRNIIRSNNPSSPIYYNTGTAGTNQITNCWVHARGVAPAWTSASRRNHKTFITNSAFSISMAARTTQVMAFASTSYGGEELIIDHSDFYSSSTSATFLIANPTVSSVTYTGNRSLTVTNSNIVNLGPGGIVGKNTNGYWKDGALRLSHNNMVSPAATLVMPNNVDGFTTFSVEQPVYTVQPTYADVATGNFSYTGPSNVVRGDEDRQPMGSFMNFATMTEGVMPPSSVKHFTVFE